VIFAVTQAFLRAANVGKEFLNKGKEEQVSTAASPDGLSAFQLVCFRMRESLLASRPTGGVLTSATRPC
jgi:hypothetical protein